MSKPLLFFCDDSEHQPFWDGHPEWNDVHWVDKFDVKRLDGNRAKTANTFSKVISTKLSEGMPYYVVTDGNFGQNTCGGSDLLLRLDPKGITRGAVYSEAPQPGLPETGKFCAFDRAEPEKRPQQIRSFLLTGATPKEIQRTKDVDQISLAIHRLHNVFLPVTLDAATLQKMKTDDQEVIDDIFREHFGARAASYLTCESEQHDKGNILKLTKSVCSSLSQTAQRKVEDTEKTLIQSVRGDTKDPDSEWNLFTLSDKMSLQTKLQNIATAATQLLKELRDFRKEIQGGQK